MEILKIENWIIKERVPYIYSSKTLGATKFSTHFLPPEYISFLEKYTSFNNPDDSAWFLMLEDFSENSGSAFSWDEFEKQGLETAIDYDGAKEIEDFWLNHLPILISVKDGYSYLAIELLINGNHRIVWGREPEYEEISHFCDSFSDLLDVVAKHITGRQSNSILEKIT